MKCRESALESSGWRRQVGWVFKPKWKTEALHLLKGSKKFLNYKRDLIGEDRIAEIESRRDDLRRAIKEKDLDAVKEASKQVHSVCEKSLAHYRQPDWISENIEVFWVAIVVALGIRAYFLQPFRIPTGSMQPSLNGIVAVSTHEEEGWDKPWFGKRMVDFVWTGRSYEKIIAEEDVSIRDIKDASFFLFSRTRIFFDNGKSVVIGAPPNEVQGIPTIREILMRGSNNRGPHFKKGDVIFQGHLTSGDLVLVDKVSYHFRQPQRGESFVFDTRGINTDGSSSAMSSQQGATHYIKRLAGVPGDEIQVKAPELYVNGVKAKEPWLRRVMEQGVDSKGSPYFGYTNPGTRGQPSPFSDPSYSVILKDAEDRNFREFFALGDNSPSSLDSRYWGTVKQHNLVGPALFSLWPFNSGHWGIIK